MNYENNLTGFPSIDKPWLKYFSEEELSTPVPEKTVYELIYENNCDHFTDTALEYFKKKITYKTMFEKIELTKAALIANRVKKSDNVIMFTSSSPELVYSLFAICRIGAVANMINPIFTHEQIIDRVNETDAEIMFVLDQLFDRIQPILPKLCIKKIVIISAFDEMPAVTKMVASVKTKKHIPYSDKIVRWRTFISEGKNTNKTTDAMYENDMPLVMVNSSGTTNRPKGIVLTNKGINSTIIHYDSPNFSYKRGDKFLQIIPCFASTGLVLSLLMPLYFGIIVILEPLYNQKIFVKDIKQYKPNMLIGATSLWHYATRNPELKKIDLSFITLPITGGEYISADSEKEINEFLQNAGCKVKLLKGYGMCELGSTVTTDTPLHRKNGSVGYPIRGVNISTFDILTNKKMMYGERGEIRVDSPARMKEYYKNPQATKEFFYTDENGIMWGRTGDIGYVDEDGFLFVLGRASDTFTSKSGEKIYCFDIEAAIRENKNVADCEVVGIPSNGHDIPVAHIIVRDKCKLSEDELIATIHSNCQQKLSMQAVPCGYKIRKNFPVKDSGKRDIELIKQDRTDFIVPTCNGILHGISF